MRKVLIFFGISVLLAAGIAAYGIFNIENILQRSLDSQSKKAEQELKAQAMELACSLDKTIRCEKIDGVLTMIPIDPPSTSPEMSREAPEAER